ncbi:hypothetical protein [Nitrospira sp. Nam74]
MSLQVRVHAERRHGIEHDRFSMRIGTWMAIRLPDTWILPFEGDISFSDPPCGIGRKDLILP